MAAELVRMQMRSDTAANWTSNNPTLLAGEMGFETNTGNFKIGDGSTAWTSLGYIQSSLKGNVTLADGDLVIGTAGHGISFDAYAAGNLLDDYEEGDWTPVDASGAALTLTTAHCSYIKIGRIVIVVFSITYPSTSDTSNGTIGGLPVNVVSTSGISLLWGGFTTGGFNSNRYCAVSNSDDIRVLDSGVSVTNATLSTTNIRGVVIYESLS